jgi:hypothetical protein
MPVPDIAPAANPYGPQITFATENILPPGALYLGPNDAIFVNAVSPSVACSLTVWYQLLRPDGTLVSATDVAIVPLGANNNVLVIPPSEGFLLSFVIQSSIVSRGQCFVRVFLVPGGQGGLVGSIPRVFLQGYASSIDLLNYPGSISESSLSGRGWLRNIVVNGPSQPTLTTTVPTNVHWLIRAISMSITTSIAAANRILAANILDPSNLVTFAQVAPATVPASQTVVFTCGSGATSASQTGLLTAGFPNELIAPTGWKVQAEIFAGDINDHISNIFVTVEEFVGQ